MESPLKTKEEETKKEEQAKPQQKPKEMPETDQGTPYERIGSALQQAMEDGELVSC